MRASISVNSIHSFDQNTDADIAISHAKETERKNKRRKALQPCLGFLKGLHTLQTLSKFIKEKIADNKLSFSCTTIYTAVEFFEGLVHHAWWPWPEITPSVGPDSGTTFGHTRYYNTQSIRIWYRVWITLCYICFPAKQGSYNTEYIKYICTHWVTVSGSESPSCSVLHHITGQVMRFVPSNSACIITCSLCRFVILEKLKFIYFFGKSFSFKRQSNSISKGLHGSYPPLEALIRPGRAPIFITLGTGQGWCWWAGRRNRGKMSQEQTWKSLVYNTNITPDQVELRLCWLPSPPA